MVVLLPTEEKDMFMTELTLQVNGRDHKVAVGDPETPLLYVLRDDLALRGHAHKNGPRRVRTLSTQTASLFLGLPQPYSYTGTNVNGT